MNNIRKILLIGRTGNGKSTLANVLVKTNKFTESEFAVSQTRKIQIEEFEEDGIKYQVIDTVGIGDTNMSLDKVLRKLALMGYSVKDGVNQILFVTDGRLSEEAKSTYDLLEKVVFDENVAKYTTVIRTKFAGFRSEEKIKEEKESMIKNSGSLKDLIEKCNKMIFTDNPSVDIDDEKEKEQKQARRKESRKILLNHLESVCKDDDTYRPINLIVLGSEIGKYMNRKKELKEKVKDGSEKKNNKIEKMPEENVSIKSATSAVIVGKKVTTQGVEVAKNIKEQSDNKILNRKITKRMIKHIGNIDLGLKKDIEEKLKQLEKESKNNKPIK
jgi:energy-coupling factor transporter ATP-binding protein EcfA2